ncbi:DinB family protein [Planctomycetes bacterium K23_9]|uniref:DinB superfamily protein n=1 Tax=Stieleria marina TaxID=1930275 RepID=A0A517NMM8_9BACT|nr:DinB superfamily protein [Planctomycetes bacterium K23_9]
MQDMPPPALPSADDAVIMKQAALGQLAFARRYTLEMLDATPRELWFTMPAGLPTNVAWQLGHLTVSQYGLLMFRIRGRRPDDLELIPGRFRKAYGRGSVPKSDSQTQPTPDELIQRLDRVFDLAMAEMNDVTGETLLESVDMPYAHYPCKLGAVLFCPLHEQIHAGHLGMLRRALDLEPIR